MGKLLTLTGPSCVGKTTLVNYLVSSYGNTFKSAIAFTSRAPRTGELDGRDYHFMDFQQIQTLYKEGCIATISEIHGSLYGHSKDSIQSTCGNKQVGLAISDLERIPQYKEYGKKVGIEVISILLLPSNFIALGKRVLQREKEEGLSRETSRERWKKGLKFISQGRNLGTYNQEIINYNLQETTNKILELI